MNIYEKFPNKDGYLGGWNWEIGYKWTLVTYEGEEYFDIQDKNNDGVFFTISKEHFMDMLLILSSEGFFNDIIQKKLSNFIATLSSEEE